MTTKCMKCGLYTNCLTKSVRQRSCGADGYVVVAPISVNYFIQEFDISCLPIKLLCSIATLSKKEEIAIQAFEHGRNYFTYDHLSDMNGHKCFRSIRRMSQKERRIRDGKDN